MGTSAMDKFSEWIDMEGLLDLPISNHAYTWSNMQDTPTLAKLDCILLSEDWEDVFPHCAVQGLPRITSDHVPLLLSSQVTSRKKALFRYESWWAECPEVEEIIRANWSKQTGVAGVAKRLAIKLRRLKKCLMAWSGLVRRKWMEEKAHSMEVIEVLDRTEENRQLSDVKRENRSHAKAKLKEILHLEEIEWRQKSKALWLRAGDGNTKFFHKFANQRRRLNRIDRITIGEELLTEEDVIAERVVNHFKEQFAKERTSLGRS
ncbi:hypothetical protein QJS04_geneDACA017941 [Acorus gramineus]|uniref:Endonuclease/exonuclease/phosphatase n=1 Tax=Acorus gramineus TaxID=55184 RepID=A0AAV9A6N9_ACOGR|nr:hypothetical protein QJS04_geneDACA017941 [Acorus gramineus]